MKNQSRAPSGPGPSNCPRRGDLKRWFLLLVALAVVAGAGFGAWCWYSQYRSAAGGIQALVDEADGALRTEDFGAADEALHRLETEVATHNASRWHDALASLRKDREVVRALEEVFGRRWGIMGDARDVAHARLAYPKIFADYGLDLEKSSADENAARLKTIAQLAVPLLAGLDSWLEAEPKNQTCTRSSRKPTTISSAAAPLRHRGQRQDATQEQATARQRQAFPGRRRPFCSACRAFCRTTTPSSILKNRFE